MCVIKTHTQWPYRYALWPISQVISLVKHLYDRSGLTFEFSFYGILRNYLSSLQFQERKSYFRVFFGKVWKTG